MDTFNNIINITFDCFKLLSFLFLDTLVVLLLIGTFKELKSKFK